MQVLQIYAHIMNVRAYVKSSSSIPYLSCFTEAFFICVAGQMKPLHQGNVCLA